MADPGNTSEIDPQRSLKRSLDQLTSAVKKMNKHLESIEAEDQEGYLQGQKESNRDVEQIEKAARRVSDTRQGTSAKQKQLEEPGSLNAGASVSDWANEVQRQVNMPPGQRVAEEMYGVKNVNKQIVLPGGPEQIRREMEQTQQQKQQDQEVISEAHEEALKTDKRMTGMGWMRPDEMERIRKQELQLPTERPRRAERKLRQYASSAESFAGKGAVLAGEKGMERTAGALGGVAQAASFMGGKASVIGPLIDYGSQMFGTAKKIGDAGTQLGVNLGYTAENAPVGGQYLFGFKNPLAAFSSAGSQGVGVMQGAIENALQGNMAFGTSGKLAAKAVQLGYANERESDIMGVIPNFLGTKNAGRNREITEVTSAGMRQGISEQTSGEFMEKIKFGGGSIKGLSDSLAEVGRNAREAGMATDQFAKSAIGYAEVMKNQGSFLHMYNKGQEITSMTGRPAAWTAATSESAMGQAAAATYGVLPGTVGATHSAFQVSIANKAMGQYASMAQGLAHPISQYNPYTKQTEEVGDKKDMQVAYMNTLSGGAIKPEQAEQYLNHKPREEQMPFALSGIKKSIAAEQLAKETHHSIPASEKGKEWGALWNQTNQVIGGKEYQDAFNIDKGGLKSREKLMEDVKKKVGNQEAQENAKIELSPDAKKFFTLNFPNAQKEVEEEAKKGEGPSMGQKATSKSTGKSSSPLAGGITGKIANKIDPFANVPIVGSGIEAIGSTLGGLI